MSSGALGPGAELRTVSSRTACRVERLLGAGGQGEVYRVFLQGQPLAVKWYYPHAATAEQRAVLAALIASGPPDARFLWPIELVTAARRPGFGYLMALREPRYRRIADLLARRVTPTFRALATAGAHLSHGFLQLHAKGLCYRDISHGNVFFDPDSGDVLICDNDNVGPNGEPGGILGTPRFMAPEVVRGETVPSTQSDLFALAVLLFLILVNHHPLEGKREADIHCFDLPAMTRLYGTRALFIFDPMDRSNRPMPGYHDNAVMFWPLYPTFIRELFVKAFTQGIRDPEHGRVRETTWRAAMSRLRDSILYCACGVESFYDAEALRASGGVPGSCWSCQRPLRLPPRIRIGNAVVMLNHDSRLYPHHLDERAGHDFTTPVAEVTRHPTDFNVWGLTNCSDQRWTAVTADGVAREVEPGRTLPLAVGTRINFGGVEGEIRL